MNISIHDMIWAIINFLVLVVILNKFLYKPLLGMLDARKQQIQNRLDEADAARSEAAKMKDEYTRQMQNAKEEAREIIGKAARLAEESKSGIIQDAKDEAAQIMKKAREEIGLEKEKAKAELRNEVASLAVMAAGKVLERSLQVQDHEKMIREFVQKAGDVS